jgi:hypothetical protein
MAKISEEFRQKMLGRKKSLTRKGVVIDKKDWTKGRLRLMPSHGNDPAQEFKSFYIKEMKKSVTAPCTFGVEDPLWDFLDQIYQTGEKADKDHAKDYCNRSTEYWTPCIVRGDEGTASNPNVRIFRLPYKAYQYIVDLMSDEDYAEDITDADEGRDILLKKEGKGVNTEWKPDKMDPEPIVEDEDLYEALVELSHKFDPSSHFFQFDLEDYVAAYEGLTNEEIPEECMEALQELADNGAPDVPASEEEEDEEEAEEEEGEEVEEEEGEEDADSELLEDPPEGIEFGVTVVSFTAEDEDENEVEAEGVVQSWGVDPDNEGEFLLVVLGEDDDPEDPWMLDVDDVEIVEVEEEEEPDEEEEPEEAEPAVRRGKKKASKKTASKKAPAKAPAKAMPRRPAAAKQIRGGKTTKKAAPKKAAPKKKAPVKKAPVKKAAPKKKATTKKKASKKPTRRGK